MNKGKRKRRRKRERFLEIFLRKKNKWDGINRKERSEERRVGKECRARGAPEN